MNRKLYPTCNNIRVCLKMGTPPDGKFHMQNEDAFFRLGMSYFQTKHLDKSTFDGHRLYLRAWQQRTTSYTAPWWVQLGF